MMSNRKNKTIIKEINTREREREEKKKREKKIKKDHDLEYLVN